MDGWLAGLGEWVDRCSMGGWLGECVDGWLV